MNSATETEPRLLQLQAIIREAAERDDAVGMVKTCLTHARKAQEIARKSCFGRIAEKQAEVGDIVEAWRTFRLLKTDAEKPEVAERRMIPDLLPYSVRLRICGMIADLYPEKALEVGKAVARGR